MQTIRTTDGIIEAAYESGFEPSSENITLYQLRMEAEEYLSNNLIKQ